MSTVSPFETRDRVSRRCTGYIHARRATIFVCFFLSLSLSLSPSLSLSLFSFFSFMPSLIPSKCLQELAGRRARENRSSPSPLHRRFKSFHETDATDQTIVRQYFRTNGFPVARADNFPRVIPISIICSVRGDEKTSGKEDSFLARSPQHRFTIVAFFS